MTTPEQDPGRPPGIDTPQPKDRKPGKIGEKMSRAKYSLKKVKENFDLASKLSSKVEGVLMTKHKLKKLSNEQIEVASQITGLVVANEDPKDWNKVAKIRKYIKTPLDTNPKRIKEIHTIALEHQVDEYVASILYVSRV